MALDGKPQKLQLASDNGNDQEGEAVPIALFDVNGSRITESVGGGGTVQDETTLAITPTDEGATAGDTRGTNAIDLQISRSSSNMVASGTNSGILAGQNNIASGTASVVVGGGSNSVSTAYSGVFAGQDNTITTNGFSVILGGQDNVQTGLNAATVGGNGHTNSGTDGVIVGGNTNAIDGAHLNSSVISGFNNSINSNTAGLNQNVSIIGGYGNTITGYVYQGAIVGAQYSTMYGANSVIIGGNSNTANTANDGVVIGGSDNATNASQGAIVGGNGNTIQANADDCTIIGSVNVLLSGDNTVAIASLASADTEFSASNALLLAGRNIVQTANATQLADTAFLENGSIQFYISGSELRVKARDTSGTIVDGLVATLA